MNIAFLAPEFLPRLGGVTTYVSHAEYLISGAEKMTQQKKKPQMNADERRLITSIHLREHKVKKQILQLCSEKH